MNQTATPETTAKYPGQLFGIIILTVIGAIIVPVRLIVKIIAYLLPLFQAQTWSALTTPGSAAYHSLWAPLLIGELAGSLILVGAALFLIVFCLAKRKLFVKAALAFLVIHLVFVLTDHLVAGMIANANQMKNASSLMDVTKAAVAVMVWFLYFKVSKKRMGEGR